MIVWKSIENNLFEAPSSEDLFNPYRDRDDEYDRPDAVLIRRENLRRYVSDHPDGVRLLLVAEAPGPWGCRFSGVPITSERQLLDPEFPARGQQSSLRPEPHSEYSAGIFWRVLQPYYRETFVWNAVPVHPHRVDRALSIRTPRTEEVKRFLPLLESLVSGLSPEKILAVGRKAENALQRIGAASTYVRHPSQGGARLFEEGVRSAVRELGLEAKG